MKLRTENVNETKGRRRNKMKLKNVYKIKKPPSQQTSCGITETELQHPQINIQRYALIRNKYYMEI